MEGTELMNLVRQMRNAQKEYFRTRDKRILACSKELERRVDKELENVFEPKMF